MAPTFGTLLQEAEVTLREGGVTTPRLDAEVLLSKALRANRAGLYTRLSEPVPDDVRARFLSAIGRRRRREPVAYITGVREFWSLPFAVTPAVLIPRPETELLVETACGLLARRRRPTLCDVGTGSGCVAIAVARAVPTAQVLAIDISPAALSLARRNAAANGVSGCIAFSCSDLFAGLHPWARFDVIVCNPPYLREPDAVQPELVWEPAAALLAGSDGLQFIRRLLAAAPARLRDGGWLVMEFGYGQEGAVRRLANAAGLQELSVQPDLAGIPRLLMGRVARQASKPAGVPARAARRVRQSAPSAN